MVICIIRIHTKKRNKREEAHSSRKKRDMHAHIEVNTVQSVCVNKREKNEREREREREGETERKIMIVVAHIGVFIYTNETSYIYTD